MNIIAMGRWNEGMRGNEVPCICVCLCVIRKWIFSDVGGWKEGTRGWKRE